MGLAMLDRTLAPESRIHAMLARRAPPSVASVPEELRIQRVEVGFVGAPPVRQVERASGVSRVEVDGSILRCLVFGSFQPFLEALRGYEVTSLESRPTPSTSQMEEP
jgi:hypothetical protein